MKTRRKRELGVTVLIFAAFILALRLFEDCAQGEAYRSSSSPSEVTNKEGVVEAQRGG